MEITWLGHNCFRIRAKEAAVVADPCDKSTGYSMGRPSADLVTVSSQDREHANVDGVAGSPRVVTGPGEFEIAKTSLVGIATPRNKDKETPTPNGGRNVSYVYELEDMRVCHLGNIGAAPSSDQVEELGDVDILLIPVGGGDALEAAAAAETVSLVEPKLVIPMHFKTDAERGKLDEVNKFLREMGEKTGETHAKISVTRSSLPDRTQVLVLDYKR